jgi:phosphohistidine phosphatase
MALFLVQHGISASKDVDPEQGLSRLGIEETNRIAPVARGYNIPVKSILHSGKKRAEQTAAIYHRALELETPLAAISGINPLDDVRVFAARIDPFADWMVVGHMPFMERLVSYLTTGSEEIRVYRFQNSGIVCLDAGKGRDEAQDWFIKWTLNPHIA